MIWRLLHIVVLGALVLAAADVYKIKYESTLQAERVAKLRGEVRREQDTIALLRAEWSRLDRPDRIQELAHRHLTLKPLEVRQYDTLDRLPERSRKSPSRSACSTSSRPRSSITRESLRRQSGATDRVRVRSIRA